MMQNILENLEEDKDNQELRVIVLAAEGPVFSAGHNLKELVSRFNQHEEVKEIRIFLDIWNWKISTRKSVPIGLKSNAQHNWFSCSCYSTSKRLGCRCRVPVGSAMRHCSVYREQQIFYSRVNAVTIYILSNSHQNFLINTIIFLFRANFGIFCSTPGIPLARKAQKSTALSMLLTGLPISAAEALNSGLVTKVCSPDDLDDEVKKICEAIVVKSRSVVELGKRFYYRQVDLDIKSAYGLGAEKMVENLQMGDGREGVRSFVEKRKPVWTHKKE